MKRAALILSILFVGLVTTGLILYLNLSTRDVLSVWRVIPEHAVAVYEVGDCRSCLTQIQENSLWMSVKEVFGKQRTDNDLQKKILADITDNLNWTVSLHLTKRNDFDLIFYLPEAVNFKSKNEQWINFGKAALSTHEYSGFLIYELKLTDQLFSWTLIDNIWVGSFTSFLIEDVIRTFKSNGELSIDGKIGSVRKLPVTKNDLGNLYIRYDGLRTLASSFLQDPSGNNLAIGSAALLDVKPGSELHLSGFSVTDNTSDNSLLAYFVGQNPVPFSHRRLISNRSLCVINYGIDNGDAFFKKLPVSREKNTQDSLTSLAPIKIEGLFSAMGKEITVCLLERRKSDISKIVLMDVHDVGLWKGAFDLLSKATETGDSLYSEMYGSYELRKIDLRNLTQLFFKPLIPGFEQTYYTQLDNTIILAEFPSDLKRFLDDIDQEDVWGKSVATNQFLESTLLESNVGIYYNVPLLKNILIHRLAPVWKSFVAENPSVLNKPGVGAVQFSNLSGMFYTHAVLTAKKAGTPSLANSFSGQRIQSVLGSAVKSPLFSVRNHTTKQYDLVFQDSLKNLCYLSSEGKIQWIVPLESEIAGALKQIDYLNNGKLQLVFVTPGKLHVIDRLGNYVNPFPISIPVQQPEFVNVIDYDNSKRYRFAVTDQSGKIWLFDKQGQPLDGWKPKWLDGKPIVAPRHYRIQGKDFILIIRQEGQVYVLNRKGDPVKGFPLTLDFRPSGAFSFEPGPNLSGSVFTCISRDGTRVRFTAEGKILSREPLVKSTVSDQFSLIEEKSTNGYLIARQNSKRLSLFDDDGREVVVNDYVGLNTVDIQYFDFGSGKIYIVVTDLDQDLCYLYDGAGNSLRATPIDATAVVISLDGGAKLHYADGKLLTMEAL